jgi:hypothetical protein
LGEYSKEETTERRERRGRTMAIGIDFMVPYSL